MSAAKRATALARDGARDHATGRTVLQALSTSALHAEARASVELDRDQTHVLDGELTYIGEPLPRPLTLPAGWESGTFETPNGPVNWLRAEWDPDRGCVYADARLGVEFGEERLTPEEARALAKRLIEAADVVKQLQAGAR
jgi:hypothetical protein